MKIPNQFHSFCLGFHQDVFALYPNISEAARASLKQFTQDDLAILKLFLEKILLSANDGELLSIWNASRSDLLFKKGADVRKMILLTLEIL